MTRVIMFNYGERRDSAARNYSALTLRPTEFGGEYRTGVHATPHGFVKVASAPDHTALDFIWYGQTYRRYWNRQWRPVTIARLAREFAEDIAAGRYKGRRVPGA